MTNIRILVTKTSSLVVFLLACSLTILSTGCKDEPKDPTVSELKACLEGGIDNVLCESHRSTFDENDPSIYVSAIFEHIDRNTNVTYTLFGKDGNGNWINIVETTNSPADQGEFDEDASRFRMNAFFRKNPDNTWVKTDYRVEAEISGAVAKGSVDFSVE